MNCAGEKSPARFFILFRKALNCLWDHSSLDMETAKMDCLTNQPAGIALVYDSCPLKGKSGLLLLVRLIIAQSENNLFSIVFLTFLCYYLY